MTKIGNVIKPQEKEELFLQFFHSYLTFLIYIYKTDKCNGDYSDRQQLESHLISSLTLMWQIHVATSTFKTYYKKVGFEHGTGLIYNEEQSKLIVPKLQEMRLVIKGYPNIEKSNKLYCLSLLEQTKHYYEKNMSVIVDASLHAAPWLAPSIKPQHQRIERCKSKDD